MIIDIADKSCPCCGGGLHKIGETQKEMFDVVPIQYRVKRIIRPRYGCRACESAVVQAPAPEQPVDGGMVCEAFLAHIATMKHAYHVPLYRLEQMLAAQGIALDRSTLALWMGRTAWWLKPLHQLLLETALSYPRLFADETPIPMLDPGRGRTKTCQFWAVATDDRPWGGPRRPRSSMSSPRIARASERRRYSRAFPAFFKWTAMRATIASSILAAREGR